MNLAKKRQYPDTYAWLGLGARVLLGGVFVYSGFLKSAAPAQEFAAIIEQYAVMPVSLTIWAAYFMSWTELYLGGFVIFGIFTRSSVLLSAGLLSMFELLFFSVLIRGIPMADCGCFGARGNHSILYGIIQNAILLLAALAAFKAGNRIFTVDKWAGKSRKSKDLK